MAFAAPSTTGGGGMMRALTRNSDVAVAFGAIMIIALMVIPIPTTLLSMLIVLNLAIGIMILLVAM